MAKWKLQIDKVEFIIVILINIIYVYMYVGVLLSHDF